MKTVLQDFLEAEAAKGSRFGKDWTHTVYDEHTNKDALTDRDWLENGTSWIWRVGVLLLIDANKADWFEAYIGTQRDDQSWRKPEFIGCLKFAGGENDDPRRVMDRALDMLGWLHPSFMHEGDK